MVAKAYSKTANTRGNTDRVVRFLNRALSVSQERVDNASLTLFRVVFGLTMAIWAWDYLTLGRVTRLYVEPDFLFSWYGFGWVQPWSGVGMYVHFWAMLLLALMIAVGFLYRFAAVGFAVLFTYFFLLDRTNYQNHYYLITIISWGMVALPLNRNVSVDSRLKPNLVTQVIPRWCLWAVQLHIAIPYFMGGVAKLTPDWMVGQPMGKMLAAQSGLPVLGPWLAWDPMALLLSYFGILFDLLVVPGLLWRRTRVFAFLLAVAFHLINSVLFDIHIFPWFMLIGSTIFFAPSWPRQILNNGKSEVVPRPFEGQAEWTPSRKLAVALVSIYLCFHAAWPLRHNLYGGETSWNERGHLFAWRMMLRGKDVGIGFALKDPLNQQVTNVDHQRYLSPEAASKFGRDPEMVLHFAHFLADSYQAQVGRRPEIYAFALTSLNGRKPQLIIDPNANLAEIPRGIFFNRDWVLPLEEPLRAQPWDVPVAEWKQYVEIPELDFMPNTESKTASVESRANARID
ncbi:MAG: HTTM domain-containing protein [Planctomycetota bacterium]